MYYDSVSTIGFLFHYRLSKADEVKDSIKQEAQASYHQSTKNTTVEVFALFLSCYYDSFSHSQIGLFCSVKCATMWMQQEVKEISIVSCFHVSKKHFI